MVQDEIPLGAQSTTTRKSICLDFYLMSHKTKRLPIILFPGCDAHIVQTSIKDKLLGWWMSDYVFTGMHLYIPFLLFLSIHLRLSLTLSNLLSILLSPSIFQSSILLSLSLFLSTTHTFNLFPLSLSVSLSLSLHSCRYQSYFSLAGPGHDWVERGGNWISLLEWLTSTQTIQT